MQVSNDAASKAFRSGEVAGLCYKEIVGHAIAIAMSTGQTHGTKLFTWPNTNRTLVTDFVIHPYHCPLLLFLLIFLPVFSPHLSARSFLTIAPAGIITTPFRGYFVLSVGCCAPVSAIPASRVSSPSVTIPPLPPHQSIYSTSAEHTPHPCHCHQRHHCHHYHPITSSFLPHSLSFTYSTKLLPTDFQSSYQSN